jgi:hypothetical protein
MKQFRPSTRVVPKTWVSIAPHFQPHRPDLASWWTAALIFLVATLGNAQNSHFLFDPAGNLLVQTAEANVPPQIIGQPASQIVAAGETASFSVVVADTLGVTYQWQFGGNNIAGATADTLLLNNAGLPSEGQYSVVVANGAGSVTSAPAMLWFDGNGNGLPDSWEMAHFGNLYQTATGDYDSDGVSNLDEFLEGTNPTDPNSFNPRLYIQTTDFGVAIALPPVRYYAKGQVATAIALPDPGAAFLGWSGAATGIKPQISLVMTAHKTIMASFGEPMPPPAFLSIGPTSSGIGLTWSAVPGRWYQLQYKTNLNQAGWNNLITVPADGPTVTGTDSTSSDAQRFYRVGLLP